MIPTDAKAAAFDAMLIEALGGPDVAAMLVRHHVDHASYRTIAGEFGLSLAHTHTRMTRARTYLRRHGLMPVAWEAPTQPVDAGVGDLPA